MSGTARRRTPKGSMSGSILRGMLLVGRGRRDGLLEFGATPDAFLASLAPLIAIPLVGAGFVLASGHPRSAATSLLATVIALLAPPVLSYEPARWWARQDHWLRYATALNWCQWLVPLLAAVLLILVYPPLTLVLPDPIAAYLILGALAAYGLWLHWFIARHGLDIGPVRAAVLVVGVNLVTLILVAGPQALGLTRPAPAP